MKRFDTNIAIHEKILLKKELFRQLRANSAYQRSNSFSFPGFFYNIVIF
ncbi:MAG TPA: hypothetical protein DEB17_04845 [Chlorobaculum sp.]|uniref:Uncharacterized protein n=1 Tax=Chlorobaculum tepidum (strain ATCC 49652 / DSM 12025 / NBRC 103806 / TLS) TaxID=194439 RepID=Q8KB18_CHLTE|nr:hypothetical protein CT1980 [Chlorobaculum tepidum TLS]HBU23312.1 hypothetical protein [Chlorobaculum sp.]